MITALVTISSVAALVLGFFGVPMVWLFLIAFGYFFCVLVGDYQIIMWLINQERIGVVTLKFIWAYIAGLIGVVFTYGAGWGAHWVIRHLGM